MYFVSVHSLRAGRWLGDRSPRKRTVAATFICGPMLAALAVCASIGNARANEDTLATSAECALKTSITRLLAVPTRSEPQTFASLLDYRTDSPILNIRANASTDNDVTGSIPALRLDLVRPQPASLTSLVPPEIVDATEDQGPAAEMIVGIASMYNPMNPADKDAGGGETASGEFYDADGWTAAIRLDLRQRFGGVGYGKNYRPTFALVEAGDKRVIVKINDIGPLKPGRIIDLNERAMRFFDPSLDLGLIEGIRVTPLAGTDWTAGPIGGEPVNVAGGYAP